MEQRIVYRYSVAFKQQVISEVESGRFRSAWEASEHYGLSEGTVGRWLKRYGRNHLLARVVRVEKPNEQDELKQLKQEVKRLEQLLGRKDAEKTFLELSLEEACQELGVDVEEFKKNTASSRFEGMQVWKINSEVTLRVCWYEQAKLLQGACGSTASQARRGSCGCFCSS